MESVEGYDMTQSLRKRLEDERDSEAEQYRDEFFKLNPNGCTVATYVNDDLLTTAYESGYQSALDKLLPILEKAKVSLKEIDSKCSRDNSVAWNIANDALEEIATLERGGENV